MNQLAIFDIDGTLTDTSAVDDECYRDAVAEALGVAPAAIDWSGATHVTDSEIFHWLCATRGLPTPGLRDIARARSGLVARLTTALQREPARFAPIPGAAGAISNLQQSGWRVALATGGWGRSARLKLNAAGVPYDEALFACADDARSRTEIVRLAITRAERSCRCTFDRMVSLGDGAWDVATAASLGLPFVGIGTGARAQALRGAGASVVLSDYTDIEALREALHAAAAPA